MFIHICPNDKYIDMFANTTLEVAGDKQHVFLVRDPKPWKYLKADINYIEAPVGSDVFNNYVNNAKKGDFIYLQFISAEMREWLVDFETDAKIGWVYWGNEFYTNLLSNFPHFDTLTQQYIDGKEPQKLSRFWLLSEYRKYKRKEEEKNRNKLFDVRAKKAASKIAFVFHFMKGDFERIQQYLDCPAEYVHFHFSQDIEYAELLKIVENNNKPLENVPFPKKIWVGNCGYPWVNHVDTFEIIKGLSEDVAICVPLSYGDAEYTKFVIAEGQKRFGKRFIPFTEYTDLATFVNILYQMDTSINGHNTPWAMGNITMLQYFGKRVYIKPDLPSYTYLKGLNIHIEDYYQFDPVKCFEPLPVTVTNLDRKMIDQEFSLEDSKRLIRHMFEI